MSMMQSGDDDEIDDDNADQNSDESVESTESEPLQPAPGIAKRSGSNDNIVNK